MAIPHIFHWIWVGRHPIPELFVRFQQTWFRDYPGWKFLLWRDKHIPELLPDNLVHIVNTMPDEWYLIEAPDIMRYAILQKHGGIYLDMDMESLRSFESIINQVKAFVGIEWDNPQSIGSAIIGAEPNHPMFDRLLSLIPENRHWDDPFVRTGPQFLNDNHGQDVDSLTMFPREYFYPIGWNEMPLLPRARELYPQAYAVHHWVNSWRATFTEIPIGDWECSDSSIPKVERARY